jgi:HK97 gp10 family phage protein
VPFIKIEGVDNVRAIAVELGRAELRIGAGAAAVVRKSAFDVERLGKQNAPVDTGHLRNTISTDFTGDGRGGSLVAEIGPTADYGLYVEAGTSRQAPQPYMGPAADVVEPQFNAAMASLADPFGGRSL